MCNLRFRRFLAGMFLVVVLGAEGLAQSPESRPLEACDNSASKPQSNRASDRELLARVEQRSEALWSKLFEIQLQEIALQTRLDDLDYRLTPDGIGRALAFVGSVRPMDELREGLRIRLEGERSRMNSLLAHLALARQRIEESIREADAELERIRMRLSSPQ